ncbi:DUF2268 domain-containing putative Zn-dependent protease [Hymenobacter chitinivorans]|uniref:DUF2268 domain-containing protein n=1 Tax=Hymenobacter chitinivorans DSM 11115 TaxID=1121954 RepID=A0A2M9BAT5_9BACT|nr:DUF2268 domain-containing putative Zn-dependent protease [Hymenobacter chitinivorans]PJJ55052.1 hypothetical protein CLV45_3401 [Hymenobacter chitinivorans DSM 11115]
MQRIVSLLLVAGSISTAVAQGARPQKVFTEDIDRFWVAYDSVQTTTDHARQLAFVTDLYIRPGTVGLADFIKVRNNSAERWVTLITKYPRFWASIRPNTLAVKNSAKDFEQSIRRFKRLYPELRDASIYFTVGGLNSGGTVNGNKVLIGTEIATGNAQTDVSEFTNPWLGSVFKAQALNNIVSLNVHEYVHTQQQPTEDMNLLGQALKEGACDFITELVIRRPLQTNYLIYGNAHEKELKEAFKQEMLTANYSRWLYNGSNAGPTSDLGYFMGYTICRAYYAQARNKRQAIKEIIELTYADPAATEGFLRQSGYYPEGWEKAAPR